MEAVSKIKSSLVPLLMDNVDTDQIIPARFLKQTTREGFGENLFRDWRFDVNGNPKKGFSLNDEKYKGHVLLAGDNFGCGSSREHAAWALYDYGFRAVISTSFADIFKNNALNNGLLPIEVSKDLHARMTQSIQMNEQEEVYIDLEEQYVVFGGRQEKFKVDSFKKMCLLHGKDEFAFLLDLKNEIKEFEHARTEKV